MKYNSLLETTNTDSVSDTKARLNVPFTYIYFLFLKSSWASRLKDVIMEDLSELRWANHNLLLIPDIENQKQKNLSVLNWWKDRSIHSEFSFSFSLCDVVYLIAMRFVCTACCKTCHSASAGVPRSLQLQVSWFVTSQMKGYKNQLVLFCAAGITDGSIIKPQGALQTRAVQPNIQYLETCLGCILGKCV